MNRIFKYALMFCFVAITLFAINQMSDDAKAADITWDGGGADNYASTGANWVGNVTPGASDSALFDSTSTKNCYFDIPQVNVLQNKYGYTGTIEIISPATINYWTCQQGNVIISASLTNMALTIQGGTIYQNALFVSNTYGLSLSAGDIIGNGLIPIETNVGFECPSTVSLSNVYLKMTGTGNLNSNNQTIYKLNITSTGNITQTGSIHIGEGGIVNYGIFTRDEQYAYTVWVNPLPITSDEFEIWIAMIFMSIATIINFVGYVRKIGLLQIVSFLVLLVGIFAATDVWEELWTLPTLFVLTNAVIFIIGMMRRG